MVLIVKNNNNKHGLEFQKKLIRVHVFLLVAFGYKLSLKKYTICFQVKEVCFKICIICFESEKIHYLPIKNKQCKQLGVL